MTRASRTSCFTHQCARPAQNSYSPLSTLVPKYTPGYGSTNEVFSVPAGTIHTDVFCNNQAIEVGQMKSFIVAFLKDEEGLTMVEYAVAGSLVAATAVTAFTDLGTAITAKIQALITAVNT